MSKRGAAALRSSTLALVIGASLVLSGCAPSADATTERHPQLAIPFAADLTARLDAALAEAMALSGASGAIAGVWAPWAGQWVVSPGSTATAADGAPLSTDMRFRIGSSTESMTCTVLLALVDAGRVQLGDTVASHLPASRGLRASPSASSARTPPDWPTIAGNSGPPS